MTKPVQTRRAAKASPPTPSRTATSRAEADRVSGRTSNTGIVHEMVVADLLARQAAGAQPNSETIRQLQALIDGASPDEVRALRLTLFNRTPPAAVGVDPDTELSAGWREGAYPYKNLLSRKRYEKQKYLLQVELLKLQAWVKDTGQRVVIIFEGRDAAGKGGAIKRFMEHLNPRGARVVALEKPSEVERGQWYFQRYIQHAPWTVIKSDCKKRARLNALRYLLHRIPYSNKDLGTVGAVDPLIVGRPSLVPGVTDDLLAAGDS